MTSYPSRRRQRLAGYDYSGTGFYFVTLCLQERLPLLGRISSEGFHPSSAGVMVQTVWNGLPNHIAGVTLDTLTVMPDHLHAIVVLSGEDISLSAVVQRFKTYTTARYTAGAGRRAGLPSRDGYGRRGSMTGSCAMNAS